MLFGSVRHASPPARPCWPSGRCDPIEWLAEYDWKPHRNLLAQTKQSPASFYWYISAKQRGTASSSSRFQTLLLQPYSANLPPMPPTAGHRRLWPDAASPADNSKGGLSAKPLRATE